METAAAEDRVERDRPWGFRDYLGAIALVASLVNIAFNAGVTSQRISVVETALQAESATRKETDERLVPREISDMQYRQLRDELATVRELLQREAAQHERDLLTRRTAGDKTGG